MSWPPTPFWAAIILGLLAGATAVAQGPDDKRGRPVPGGKPHLVPVWQVTTIGQPESDDINADMYKSANEWVAARYLEVLNDRKTAGKPLIPPAVPVGVGDLVVYTSDRSIAARAVRATKLYGEPAKPGDLFWEGAGDGGLIQMSRELGPRFLARQWTDAHREQGSGEIWFHRTLSTAVVVGDGHAHAVDELAILPPERSKGPGWPSYGALTHEVMFNWLKAWNLETGKLIARYPHKSIWERTAGREGVTQHILGPPAVAGDRWYLIEDRAARLVVQCRDWKEHAKHIRSTVAEQEKGGRVWEQELLQASEPVSRHPQRRIHAIHLLKAGPLVICPTHLGYVAAVDSDTGHIRWFHEYSPVTAKRFETFAPEWVVVPPVVAGDKYVYAPADFPELLCLNLADGKKVWTAKKGDGLYPAVVGEQVLVIGEKTIRSLRLADGTEAWKADLPGLPCGRGAVLGDTYLVPVSEPKTWRGMIAVVDLKAGKVAEVLKPAKDVPVGNLVVHGDVLLSQTLTDLAVYPIRNGE